MRGGWLLLVLAAACGGPTTLSERMSHAEDQGRRAETLLDDAERELKSLNVERADALLGDARKALSDPDIGKYPDHHLLKERLAEDDKKLDEAKGEVRQRDLERAVLAHRQVLEVSAGRLEKALEGLKRPDFTKDHLEEVADATEDLTGKLDNGAELERKDADLLKYHIGLRKSLEESGKAVKEREKVLAFREGPLAAREEALSLLTKADAEADPAAQKEVRVDALGKLRTCADRGRAMLAESGELSKAKVLQDGKPVFTEIAVAGCEKQVAALEKKLKDKPKKVAAAKKAKPAKKAAVKKKRAR